MAHTMDLFAAHEPYLVPSMDPFAVRESHRVPAEDDDFGWLALEDVIDNWAGWLDPVNPDHTDAATTNTSRPTPPSLPPQQPAPIHFTVAPIAEDDVETTGPSFASAIRVTRGEEDDCCLPLDPSRASHQLREQLPKTLPEGRHQADKLPRARFGCEVKTVDTSSFPASHSATPALKQLDR